MVGFYEEWADFAAMSEDDGFMGQCAQAEPDCPAALTEPTISGECGIVTPPRSPQQLQLLVVLERIPSPL